MADRPHIYSRRLAGMVLAAQLLAAVSLLGQPSITCRLSMPEPWTHLFNVTMERGMPSGGKEDIDVMLPAWQSGRYVIFDFAGLRIDTLAVATRVWWGLATPDEGGRTNVRGAVRGSCAYAAGVEVKDEIAALDGFHVNTATLVSRIAENRSGDTLRLTLFRRERQMTLKVPLTYLQRPAVRVLEMDNPTLQQREIRRRWLDSQN